MHAAMLERLLPKKDPFLQRLVHTGRITCEQQQQLTEHTGIDFCEPLWRLMDPAARDRFDRYMCVLLRRAEIPPDTTHMELYRAIATCGYLV